MVYNGLLAKKLDDIDVPVMDFKDSLFIDIYNLKDKKEFIEENVISYLFLLIPLICGKNESKNITSVVKNYVKSNYIKNLSVEDISCDLGYSRQHISRIFKKDMKISVQQYLINIRLQMAKELLKKGYFVSETTFMCGYNDTFNFSKCFKKNVGISPKKWQIENTKF
jgi:AraC-like DNA-binding protein